MKVDEILEKHGLNRNVATKYIDAITRMNQTETADKIDVLQRWISRRREPAGVTRLQLPEPPATIYR